MGSLSKVLVRARATGRLLGRPGGDGNGPGDGQPGDQPGEQTYEVEVPLDELTRMMLEDLALPWLEEKPERQVTTTAIVIRMYGAVAHWPIWTNAVRCWRTSSAMPPEGSLKWATCTTLTCATRSGTPRAAPGQCGCVYAHGSQWLDDHEQKVHRQKFFLLDGAVLAPEVSSGDGFHRP